MKRAPTPTTTLTSVVLPTFNRSATLAGAAHSVLQQDVDLELIIVDDGSTDETPAVLEALQQDPRVVVVRQNNRGAAAARNAGLARARGPWVAFIDSDDEFYAGKLRLQLAAIQSSDAVLCYCSFDEVWPDGTRTRLPPDPVSLLVGDVYPQVLDIGGSVIATPTVLTRTADVIDVGGFDETMSLCEDQDLWRRLARRGPFIAIVAPQALVRRRLQGPGSVKEEIAARLRFYHKAFGDDPALNDDLFHELVARMYALYAADTFFRRRDPAGLRLLLRALVAEPRHLAVTLRPFASAAWFRLQPRAWR